MNLKEEPTIEQLHALLATCDGAYRHVIWIDRGGEVHTTPIPTEMVIFVRMIEPCDYAETQDVAQVRGLYQEIMELWERYKQGLA